MKDNKLIMDKKKSLKSISNLIRNCYKCGSTNLKTKKDFIILGNKSTEMNVVECQNCRETYSTMNDTEKVRKILRPSILNRILSWFNFLSKPTKLLFLL